MRARIMRAGLEDLLEKTSRTFALSIPVLPEPTRRQVMIAYLLFRIADTFEDAAQWPPELRIEVLREFQQLLSGYSPEMAARLAAKWTAAGPSPKVRLPHWIPLAAATADTFAARLTGRVPRVPLEAVRMSRHRMFFDSSKAIRELGLPQTPIEEALSRAVAWFRENGYVCG